MPGWWFVPGPLGQAEEKEKRACRIIALHPTVPSRQRRLSVTGRVDTVRVTSYGSAARGGIVRPPSECWLSRRVNPRCGTDPAESTVRVSRPRSTGRRRAVGRPPLLIIHC